MTDGRVTVLPLDSKVCRRVGNAQVEESVQQLNFALCLKITMHQTMLMNANNIQTHPTESSLTLIITDIYYRDIMPLEICFFTL